VFARILLLHAHSFILHELQQVVMNDISAVSAIEGTNSILNFEARKCHGRLFWVSIFASGHRGFFFGWQLKKEAMPAGASCHEVDSRTEAGTRRTALPSVDSGSNSLPTGSYTSLRSHRPSYMNFRPTVPKIKLL
jgi:hypothetical protein